MEKKIKVCFINSVCGFGSTGRIVEDLASMEGVDGLIIYGRKSSNNCKAYKMTSFFGNAVAAINTILFNKNGLSNKRETYKAILKIKEFNPDIIHLHNLHGYYINYEILFKFLKEYNKPVVWTLHDCWPFTGYCPYFDYIGCDRYKIECNNKCPYKFSYPFSLFKQDIKKQYYLKKELFTGLNDLTIVTPSRWLKEKADVSFLKDIKKQVIYNGIDLNIFKPSEEKNKEFTIIFVANVWTKEKGLHDIEKLLSYLDKDINIIIVGAIKASNVIKNRCMIIQQTKNKQELVNLYSKSHIFVNPTLQEAFGLVNAEALACGTPVVGYKTGAVPEIIDDNSGVIVEAGDVVEMAKTINTLKNNYYFSIENCIARAEMFSKKNMLDEFMNLYEKVMFLK